MESIRELKEEANKYFNNAARMDSGDFGHDSNLQKACLLYGKCVEYMLKHEAAIAPRDKGELDKLKCLVFTNLAIANMKLGNHEGCLKCCNIAIVFCNDPSLSLEAISDYDDETNTVDKNAVLRLPIENKDFVAIATKIMFRRGKCHQESFEYQLALSDFRMALSISPLKIIESAITEVEEVIKACEEDGIDREKLIEQNNKKKKKSVFGVESNDSLCDEADKALTRNGGRCYGTQCRWSQTKAETTVHIPYGIVLNIIIQATQFDDKECENGGCVKPIEDATVTFEESEVFVRYTDNTLLLSMVLEYNICPADSSYSIAEVGKAKYLVLRLRKRPSLEHFEGCEWWDRVFLQDQPIDTAACSST